MMEASEKAVIYAGVCCVAAAVALWAFLDYREMKYEGLPAIEIAAKIKSCEDAGLSYKARKNAYGAIKSIVCDTNNNDK